MTVCGYEQGAQNNWLITQHINTTLDNGDRLSQVTVQVNSVQSVGPTTQDGVNNFQKAFNMMVYETSSIDSAAAREPSNYLLVSSLTACGSGEAADLQQQTQVLNINLNTSESGFYLAIVDHGTHVSSSVD